MKRKDLTRPATPTQCAGILGSVAVCLPLLFAAAPPALADGDWSQYEATVRAASASPPWNGPTEPAIAPKGKYLVGVSCTWTLAGCKLLAQGVETAAARLGWRSKTIVVNDPNGYDQALQTAINSGADGIVLTGVDQNLIPGGLELAKKKKVPVVSIFQYNKGGDLGVATDVHPDAGQIGKYLADAAIVNNHGVVHALFLEDAEFSLPVTVLEAVKAELAACSACKITYADPINFTANTVATTLSDRVVGALRRDPAINSIFLGFDPPASLIVPALDVAGFKGKVTMYSQLGNAGPLSLVRDGNIMAADASSSEEWGAWGGVDEVIRLMDGQPIVEENIPVRLLTSADVSQLPPVGEVWVGTESGFRDRYSKLWGLAPK
jgi:ribose transport system substrate-binding protein